MIFLRDNILLENDLIIRNTGADVLYVVGPGHGALAILSCLWLEQSLTAFFPQYSFDYNGLKRLVTHFSVLGGFPRYASHTDDIFNSHFNAETPGVIHEDSVAVCVVGDGEAETGPTSTAWHNYKFIDPAESGAVLPIVHANGFKISERTIFGVMDDKEIVALFTGYGYQARIVSDLPNIDHDLAASLEWALAEIKNIQSAARRGQPIDFLDPNPVIEGSFRSHQVPLPQAKTSWEELETLKHWLKSYQPQELFNTDGTPTAEVLRIVPELDEKKMGQRQEAYKAVSPLQIPDWMQLAVKQGRQESCMEIAGNFLKEEHAPFVLGLPLLRSTAADPAETYATPVFD
ncbi:hypothetical protein AX17_004877 [Amanita inopinata Kibby_2008]|nr:hypothetical protein AX17_004877 [Amanita inopinata Kibby_2008]